MLERTLLQIYELLYERYGPQQWWPGDSQIEIIIGAILTQNTNWGNVEKAINNLRSADCLNAKRLHKLKHDELAELIRPAGYFNIKAKRLKNFINWLFEEYDGDLKYLAEMNVERLRTELLSVNGIGKETADSIILYAFEMPVFVIDSYTYRVVSRHGLIDSDVDYEELRSLFENHLDQDVKLFNEYHALLVQVGKEYCRPKPRCHDCPLDVVSHEDFEKSN